MKMTTLKLSEKTLKQLNKLKNHPRETNEEVLKRLIKKVRELKTDEISRPMPDIKK